MKLPHVNLYIKKLRDLGAELPNVVVEQMASLEKQDIFAEADSPEQVEMITLAVGGALKSMVGSMVTDEDSGEVTALLEQFEKDVEYNAKARIAFLNGEVFDEEIEELINEAVDMIEPLKGLTVEQTITIYEQVSREFENDTRIAEMLKFNAGL